MPRATVIMANIAIAAALVGCSDAEEEQKISMVGLPNPAAVFCIEKGGSYDSATGLCTLSEGTKIDGWDYYRQAHESKPVGMPNPAAVFCDENGTYNLETGECTLGDGAVLDAWKFYRDNHSS